jgi:hypothetical protein
MRRQTDDNKPEFERSFGLWKKKAVDGVRYQEQIRAEWEAEARVSPSGSRAARMSQSCDETA